MTIEQNATLFQKAKSTINEHILNIYKEEELEEEPSMRKSGISDFYAKLNLEFKKNEIKEVV